MFTIPVFGVWPDVATGVVMLVFVMMAVGLNIVVGYAGLLDLGYVAFYATGAYTAAWFASPQFAGQKCPTPASASTLLGARPEAQLPLRRVGLVGPAASTSRSGSCCSLAGVITALFGILIGLPTLRLRGDYLAIVTLGFGEILPQIARNGDNFFGTGFNLTNGPNGITPLDSLGFGNRLSDWTGGFLPVELPHVLQGELPRAPDPVDRLFFWTAIVLLLFTVFCSLRLQYSRLGRAWIAIREDETAAAAMGIPLMRTKTWAYASGAFFGGVAGAYYARLQERDVPGRLLLQHLGLHPLHGHPRRHGEHLGRDRRRARSSRTSTRRGSRTPARGSTRTSTSAAGTRTSTCRSTRPASTA